MLKAHSIVTKAGLLGVVGRHLEAPWPMNCDVGDPFAQVFKSDFDHLPKLDYRKRNPILRPSNASDISVDVLAMVHASTALNCGEPYNRLVPALIEASALSPVVALLYLSGPRVSIWALTSAWFGPLWRIDMAWHSPRYHEILDQRRSATSKNR